MGSISDQNSHQSSTSGINPKFLPFAMDALKRAEQVGDMGYVPYMGNDIAVPDSLINSWQSAANRSATFNTPGQAAPDIRSTLPLQTQDGVQGFSSYDGYKNQLAQLQQNYPALYEYIKSFAIDPVTGVPGSRTFNPDVNHPGGGGGGGHHGRGKPGLLDDFLLQGGFVNMLDPTRGGHIFPGLSQDYGIKFGNRG